MLVELVLLGVTAEALQANIGSISVIFLQRGPDDPKFQVEGVAPTNHSSSQKNWLNDFSYGIKIWISLFRFVTIHAFDRRTDRQKDRRTDGRTNERTDGQLSHRYTASAFRAAR